MKKILGFVREYFVETDKHLLVLSCGFISLAIFINYYFGLNRRISTLDETRQYFSWFAIFLVSFAFGYLLRLAYKDPAPFKDPKFMLLLVLAPAIFAWKMCYDVAFPISKNMIANAYWNRVAYYPFKLVVITLALLVIWRLFDRQQPFYGMGIRHFDAKPYLLMLLFMVPLIAAASTQSDFLVMYPKLKHVLYLSSQHDHAFYKLLYELSYGSDFIGIELFFRGFLVLAFVKWVGKDAILPMALFYCTIHFGKPLGECISSFFGGIILGIVTYHTRTIIGGLIVHLGIAWMMELGGFLGNELLR